MNNEISQKVISILASIKRVPPETIRAEASFDELGIDSLDKINVLFELESEFNISIPDDEARAITTVGGIIDRLEKLSTTSEPSGA